MKLKYKEELKIVVDYDDLDEFVNHIFPGSKFEFCAAEECANDSSHSYDIDGVVNDWDLKDIEAVKKGRWSFMTSTILTYLAYRKLIPVGRYVIEVCW